MNTVEKRRQTRRNKFFTPLDCKVAEGRLSDVINSSLGYALTYYHTVEGDMYKEWMNEKRTKKDFRLKNDDDKRLWVRIPDGKSDEEVEAINLVFDESSEFNEIVKKYLFNELPLENTPQIERDYQATSVCPFYRKKLEDDNVRHHAHVVGVYLYDTETCFYKAG